MKILSFSIRKKLNEKYGITSCKDVICVCLRITRKFHLEPFIYIDENNKPCEMSNRMIWCDKKTAYDYTEIRAMRYWNKFVSIKYEVPTNWIYYF